MASTKSSKKVMSKREIWNTMSADNKQRVIDSLYKHCQVRTATSRQVFDGMVSDLGLIGTAHIVDASLEIIRPYKNTGENLESTAEALYALFYPQKNGDGLITNQTIVDCDVGSYGYFKP